ncbi:MAG: tripartite tricarboxylate transporter substrate-binding protein [Enterobacterales bacterium endosymbiont of Blomia tropicalis]|uniref:Bug family tripartite tricarboxylate transporter substrate binding protein n=1 Tax=Mixta mediterraneensis TaxID=2758443 RepID=UPI0025A82810|nr:tripartite tricarboxylate transporter substrate-binding protein [Mixta mediterraneensis]MDL4915101.1 tripartite tricarboxylate transporter substrate-binding protein [Mixta mediterraneensis]
MGISRQGALLSFALTAATCATAPAFGQSVEEFYHGKVLTLLVSADAGTPTDTFARQFARFYSTHIPGHPIPVVQNVVGAGGMVAAASLQSSQPKDGTVVGFLQRNNLYTPLLEPHQSNFDPRQLTWLGSLDKVSYSLVAMSRTGVTTADDLFRKTLFIGATGFSSENRVLPAVLNEYANTKLKIVSGYTGRSEVYLAMQRGEVDGWTSTLDGLEAGEPARMLADGRMKVILQLGWKSDPAFPDVPNLSAYITNPDAKALLNFFLAPFEAGRPIAVPKGVPQDRLDALRKAFAETMKDPEFTRAMTAAGFPIEAIDGKEVENIISTLYATPDAVLKKARQFHSR